MTGKKGKKKQRRKLAAKIAENFVRTHDELVFRDPEELVARIADYKADCETDYQPMTVTGMALAVGLDRTTFLNFSKEDLDDDDDSQELVAIITSARQLVEDQLETKLIQGNASAGAQFNLKANFKWRDVTKVALGGGKDGDDPVAVDSKQTIDPESMESDVLRAILKNQNDRAAT